MEHGVAYAQWQPWPDVRIATWLVSAGDAHVRVHHLQTARKLVSAETGFATGYSRSDTLAAGSAMPGSHHVASPEGYSALRDLGGARRGAVVMLEPGSHLLFPLAAMPALCGQHAPGQVWFACVVWGSAAPSDQPRWDIRAVPGGFVLHRQGELWCECRGPKVVRVATALRAADVDSRA